MNLCDSARQDVEGFRRLFPGRCLPCSNHRYGMRHLGVPPGDLVRHHCIELNGNIRGHRDPRRTFRQWLTRQPKRKVL